MIKTERVNATAILYYESNYTTLLSTKTVPYNYTSAQASLKVISFSVSYSHDKPHQNHYTNALARSYEIIAEHLRAELAQTEPQTLENLVITHRSQNFWLSRDCPSVRPCTKPHSLKNTREAPILTVPKEDVILKLVLP